MADHPIKPGVVSIVPVRITGPTGRIIVHAIIDTGATYTMFPPPVLAAVGLLPSSQNTIKIITASSIEYVPVLKLSLLELLGERIEDLQVVSHYLPPGIPAQGLVGVNAFINFKLSFDYPNRILNLCR